MEVCFDLVPARFQERRQGQTFTEHGRGLVGCEAGPIRGNLTEYPPRFTEVNRVKIEAVDDRRDLAARPRSAVSPLLMFIVVGSAKSYMVNATNRGSAKGQTRLRL